jgi:two-component system LytT family response regulator
VLAIVPYDKMNPTRFGPQLVNVVLAYMPLEVAVYLLVALAGHAVDYYARYREREVQAAELERLLAEARLHALQLQIRPHFLFNTLNSISALVRTGDAAKAATMINRLSELLRYALERSEDQRVPLDDEIAVLRGYLEIQAVRFEDRLSWDIDVEPAACRGAVPVLLLQPLAENAVMHGIARSQAAGAIRVRARRAGEALEIEMFNTGRLLADDGEGIGLANTRARPRTAARRRGEPRARAAGRRGRRARDAAVERGAVSTPAGVAAEPLRVLVVDDEPLARRLVRALLATDPDVSIVAECSGVEAAAAIDQHAPDIVFLDVQMPEVDGFEVVEQGGGRACAGDRVRDGVRRACAACVRRARDRLRAEANRRCPVRRGRSHTPRHWRSRGGGATGRTRRRLEQLMRDPARMPNGFLVRARDRTLVVRADEIDWIEASDYYATLHTRGQSHLLRETLSSLERRLDPARFFRVHRSAIVNLDRVREIQPLFHGDGIVVLEGGTQVRLSRARRPEFERLFAGER